MFGLVIVVIFIISFFFENTEDRCNLTMTDVLLFDEHGWVGLELNGWLLKVDG
ncbi:hypothetical protein L3i20_v237950 [Paenibacillus sp. L3-i20]|nr:hypothetical protein L3i20_v237950 [Paenibacillus sp. L3-i20]